MEKVVVRGANWIGDVVMSMPFFKGLKTAWPDAEISVLTRPHLAPLYAYNPSVKLSVLQGKEHRLMGWFRNIKDVRSIDAERALCLPHSFGSALFLWFAGVPKRYGRACHHRSIWFTHPVYGTIEEYEGHQMDFYLEMLEAITGFKMQDRLPEIFMSDRERGRASALLSEMEKPVLGMFCSAAYGPAKIWPMERFIELAKGFRREKGGSVVLFGSVGDRERNATIMHAVGKGAYDLAGKTNLLETAAVMESCQAVVANDSGPMHLAAATGVRTMGIFGSTDPQRTSPRGKRAKYIYKGFTCSPCKARTCRYGSYACLSAITPEEVLREIL